MQSMRPHFLGHETVKKIPENCDDFFEFEGRGNRHSAELKAVSGMNLAPGSDPKAREGARSDLKVGSKKQFSVTEDRIVVMFVAMRGAKNWALLASQMPNRTAKQCRERWHNHLNPMVNRGPWSLEEDRLLVQKQKELGNKWADIARHLPGRTDTLVKNRWNTSLKCRLDEFADIVPQGKRSADMIRLRLPPISSFDLSGFAPFQVGKCPPL
jgi:hypothetical protein